MRRGIVEDYGRSNLTTKPLGRLRSRIYAYPALAIAGLTISLTSPAQASTLPNLIENPNFVSTNGVQSPTQVNVAPSGPACASCTINPGFSTGADIGPWSVSGLVVLFGPDPSSPSGTNADVPPGAPYQFNTPPSNFTLYGPGSAGGSQHNDLGLGPSGGNFLALDGAQEPIMHSGVACGPAGGSCEYPIQGSISQTIHGLTVGLATTVHFAWAAGQECCFSGATTEQMEVSLCPTSGCTSTDILKTPVLDNPQGGFQNWRLGTPQNGGAFTFVPTSTSEVLTFLAIGTPNSQPPIVLLDGGVSLSQVPEPGTWGLLGIGLATIAGVGYRRPKWLSLPT